MSKWVRGLPDGFAEFLLSSGTLNEEQWLAVMAEHWASNWTDAHAKRMRVGDASVELGYLGRSLVEEAAEEFEKARVEPDPNPYDRYDIS